MRKELVIRGTCDAPAKAGTKVIVGETCIEAGNTKCTSVCGIFKVVPQDAVVCYNCSGIFDLFSAEICKGHPSGGHLPALQVIAKVYGLKDISEVSTPVCPYCGACLCTNRDVKEEDFGTTLGIYDDGGPAMLWRPETHSLQEGIVCRCKNEDCACVKVTVNDEGVCDYCKDNNHTELSMRNRRLLRKYGAPI